MCDICAELEKLSYETWDRIMFAHTRRGLRIYETTLTQNILFSLRRFQEKCTDYSLSLSEAIDETVNGNDIELVVQTSQGYLKLPTQAKLLYSNLKYTAINHPGSSGYQVDDLIHYALSIGGIPMYLLYNYVPHYTALRDHGCTMLTADYIKNNFSPARSSTATRWKIPSFHDLHLSTLPWHYLICDLLNKKDALVSMPGLGQNIHMEKLQFYTQKEIKDDERWQEFEVFKDVKLSKIANDENKIFREDSKQEFNPRFRVVISNKDN